MDMFSMWQCRNCGERPHALSGDKPCDAICSLGGKHVWMRIPEGSSNHRDWQCLHCGEHPHILSGRRPAPQGGCPRTGKKHVWILL